ncbi:MAG: DUF4249 domain-containing protein, partial [Chitinophagaceae bacterium]|nr:DUF4249 domain-containing protein [Chitinophagaceae bacterium]
INSGQGETSIKLSRTLALSDTTNIKAEQGALLSVEGDDNSVYQLMDQGNGVYQHSQLLLNEAGEFRLHIKTANGKEYYSDFAQPIKTPPIDSVSWTRETTGVQININTHDPFNKTHYYTWNYDESWEVDAQYIRYVKFLRDSLNMIVGTDFINPDQSADTMGQRCWRFSNSSKILTGSSAKLSEDVIHLPLLLIDNNSIKLSQIYSVKVYQHACSAGGYEFLQRLKKNTEETGSVFDSQPSELNTNIHNIADTKEIVFGYIDVTDLQESRIFIYRSEVPDWGYRPDCNYLIVPTRTDPVILRDYSIYYPVIYTVTPDGTPAVSVVTPNCADCRLTGASDIKPSFWPR